MSRRYLIDSERDEALRRLRLLEAQDDPGTIAHLETIGVAGGWRCLEVGAGAGSIAAWLGRRVGPRGRVVATDLNTQFLDALELENVEVREHDLAADPLDESAFDLVHARSVLMHIPERDQALEKLVRALGAGGWLLLEEPDSSTDGADPSVDPRKAELYAKVVDAIYRFVRDRGLDPGYGARLFASLHDLGLEELRGDGRLHLFRGGAEPRSAHTPAFAELEELVIAEGQVTVREYRAFLALAEDPAFTWREALMVAAWGRKPV